MVGPAAEMSSRQKTTDAPPALPFFRTAHECPKETRCVPLAHDLCSHVVMVGKGLDTREWDSAVLPIFGAIRAGGVVI